MRALRCLAVALLAMPSPVWAQDHGSHGAHAGHGASLPPAEDHSAHGAQSAPPEDHAGHAPPPPPAPPRDHAADAYYDPAEMARARALLRHEAGGMGASMLLVDRFEWRPSGGGDGYAWEVEGWTGGDLDRLAFKSRGEGTLGSALESMEVQAGWSHALDPWFNLRAGIRQDIRPRPMRTHAMLAIEGLAPYWFEVEGELFLSNKGELTARAEASYDQRITQSLIAQPAMELNLSAQDAPELGMGPGLTSVELGLRLRYEIVREFAPYVGVHWERALGGSARYARSAGEDPQSLRVVAGLRLWF